VTQAPQRIATDGREGFPCPLDSGAIRVYINGDLKRGVVAYDMIEGWADVIAWDEQGEPRLTDTGDYIAQRYRGKIVAVMV